MTPIANIRWLRKIGQGGEKVYFACFRNPVNTRREKPFRRAGVGEEIGRDRYTMRIQRNSNDEINAVKFS